VSAYLYIPITGRLIRPARPGEPCRNPFGESLDRDWQGAELGYFESLTAAREAATEVLRRGWDLGVHWPLVAAEPQRHRWFDPDPAVRERALQETGRACALAAGLGASYILFHFPWPVLLEEGLDYCALGWGFLVPGVPGSAWTRDQALAWAEVCLDRLEEAGREAGLEVVLEIDESGRLLVRGPAERDALTGLLEGREGLSVCLDTGRLALIARTHGLDCLELARRWYPLTTHLHLHAANSKRRVNHVPVLPSQSPDEGWAPSVEMARELLARPPGPDASGRGLRIVLEHDPGKVTPGELEECHRWVRDLARTLPPPGAGRR